MTVEAVRFNGEVFGPNGESLGEARFWAAVERRGAAAPWQGWLQITDLRANELPSGRYRVRSADGWEAEFEPLTTRPSRVFEIDLLPVRGAGDAAWPAWEPPTRPRVAPFSDDRPPRTADDRTRFPDLEPLGLGPREGVLPSELPWPAVPEE
jgi:hypothetical protein